MTQTISILGRQPALGLAELESLYGAETIHPIGDNSALIDLDHSNIKFENLGGSIKLAKLLNIIDTTNWSVIEKYLIDNVTPHSKNLPEGKMILGISVYGLQVDVARINATALTLKKVIKNSGKSIRVVPNKTAELSSAQVLHNSLTGDKSWELLLIKHGSKTVLAQTTNVQNIDAYAARDQKRPKRDAKVGMLPPKLAQIIVNLATGQLEGKVLDVEGGKISPEPSKLIPKNDFVVLDPFCGTGVILQEAMLMRHYAYGTDLEPRMIEFTKTNLEWLLTKISQQIPNYKLNVGDATIMQWEHFDTVACETYLGRPFSALPKPEILRDVMETVDIIHKKFLINIAKQTKSGTRFCLAVPAWKTKYGFTHLKTLDNLSDLGYTRSVFTHVDSKDLIYHRPEQIVARELVVLTRK